jgi:hypothetical protein
MVPSPVRLLLAAFVLLTVGTGRVAAATVIVVETESYVGTTKVGTATVYLDDARVRIDSDEGGNDFTVIYHAIEGRPTYWVIDRKAKTYYEFDRAAMLKTRRDLEESIKVMRRQLKSMPPAQREQMERTMKQNMLRMGFTETRIEYTPVSRDVKVSDWRCTHYQGDRAGVKVEEVWAAAPNELGIGDEDLRALGKMAELFESTGQDMPAFFSFKRTGREDETTYDGFPVIVVSYEEGKRQEKSQVKEVRSEELADDFFDLPQGFSKRDLRR